MLESRLFEYFKTHTTKELELLVCEDSHEAKKLADVASFFKIDVITFPDLRSAYLDDLRSFTTELQELFSALRYYNKANKKPLIISPIKTLLFNFPKASLLNSETIEFAQTINIKEFKNRLLHWGYNFVDIVQVKGEVSFRGDIIDIFSPNFKNPIRISLFDEEIEDIKEFDKESQRSIAGELDSIELQSAYFSFSEAEYENVLNKIDNSQSDSFVKDIASLGFWYLENNAEAFIQNKKTLFIKELDTLIEESYLLASPQVQRDLFECDTIAENETYKNLLPTDFKLLIELHKNKKTTVIASNKSQLKQADLHELKNIEVIYSPIILNIISDNELVISLNKTEKKRRTRKSAILLDDLKPGDYVVHEDYGVGIFEKIEQTEILGGIKDFIAISYQGDDRVLLPVENLDFIDRYIASGSLPILDRLGKGSFGKLKDKVKKRLLEIASQIVNTAAARSLLKAQRLKVNKTELLIFQKSAGFEYTQDQSQSIEEITTEMNSGRVMDRLLSGDVGFGKTEVAMNAMYATYKAGFQSAIIVPTTLLSSQHYKSLKERFAEYDIKIAKLDRFVTAKEKKAVVASLEDGSLDMIIGTHSLFGVKFKKLGLVIIDEEHKFGVKQKEKLKELYSEVHLLSMSATPIPRSLNQALSSIKTMSQLLNAPSERIGVRTFIKAYEEKMVKEVILRELRRGGQVFYVHNNIDSMSIKEGELKALLPNLRILILHSKISAVVSEKELMRFQNREYDLLLATSIIESGIHMPNVNTMLIDGADRFGIADLHQLRGRVGRGHVEGFAYFIVEDKDTLTDEAKKRLVALESNSFLGSGSVLAYHDLEIRGGGNLVGDAQSGHIKNIGYSLYLRMLEDSIKELTNKEDTKKAKVDIKLTISAYVSSEVITEDRLRLELYRRLSHCESPKDIYEIEEEIIDRFGKLDTPTKQFFELMAIKVMALNRDVKIVSSYAQNITIEFNDGKKEYLKSPSKDDDDILNTTLAFFRKLL
ncbi:MAG: DEAD/DEAH box helicase [Helicobacteraceae bacterium]|nr:DEAD/DEAH box helicase [Helicobacteraceae bacterium]